MHQPFDADLWLQCCAGSGGIYSIQNVLPQLGPSPCGNFSTLHTIDLSSTGIAGNLSSNWDFPELVLLNISNTTISGSIPQGVLLIYHHSFVRTQCEYDSCAAANFGSRLS